MENKGEKLIKNRYWGSEEFRKATEKAAKRTEIRTGESIPNEPTELIENYLKRFTDILDREDNQERDHGIQAIQRLLHKKYVINSNNISDDYIKGVLFGNFAEQKGYTRKDLKDPDIKNGLLEQFQSDTGHDFNEYNISEQEKENIREMAIKDQVARLDSWLSYLTSKEAENYPAAYRYWALAEMVKLGNYDDERKVYNKRTETTAASFPELDQQALALVFDEIRRKQDQEPSQLIPTDKVSQDDFNKRLQAENFGKLYAFMQEHLKSLRLPEERLIITKGEWRTFPKGSDPKQVAKALEGFHTQWCIAGEGTAAGYLEHSDLNIYFSQDIENKNITPRACIVDSKDRGITEVRGIMSDDVAKQHLDDHITPVVEEKLAAIPGGEKWQQQMEDMKQLAAIHVKHRQRDNLNQADLKFIYEIDHNIQGTGYDRDPRIKEIRDNRNPETDMPIVFECTPEQIAHSTKEINQSTRAYIGPLEPGIFDLIREHNIEHIYTSFPEGKIRQYQIEIGGKEKTQLEQELKAKNIYVSDYAQDLLNSSDFTTTNKPEQTDLVHLTVKDLGFPSGATTDEIYKRAEKLGLELCPAEVGPNLRLQNPSKEWMVIAMKQISDRSGDPSVFYLPAPGDLLGLSVYRARPDRRWDPEDEFVFSLRKKES